MPPLPTMDLSQFAGPVREQVEEARRQAETALEQASPTGRLGMIYHTYRLDAQALVCYERARGVDAGNPRWHYFPGLIALRQADAVTALNHFRAAVKLAPHHLPLKLRLAEAYIAANQAEQAKKIYEQVIESGEALPYAHLGLGRLLESQTKLNEAEVELQLAVNIAPRYREARFALAQVLRRQGKGAAAEAALALHGSLGDEAPPIEDQFRDELLLLDISSLGLINRAAAYDATGQLDRAIEELLDCLRLYPGNVGAHSNLISLYARTGKFQQAEAAYRAVMRIRPTEPHALFNWANTLAAQNRFQEAVDVLRQTQTLSPDYPGAATLLGDLLSALGQRSQAEAQYRQALRLRPADPVANLGLGVILAQSRPAEALPHLRAGLRAPGASVLRAYRGLDDVFARLKMPAERRENLEMAHLSFLQFGSPAEIEWLRSRQRSARE